MSYRTSTTKERYLELIKDPVFFCKYKKKAEYNNGDIRNVGNGWISCNPTIHLFVSDSILPENDSKRKLFVIERQEFLNGRVDELKEDTDIIYFEVTEFDPQNQDHWCYIFTDCAYNYQSGNRNYCHMALFWALYTQTWNADDVWNALSSMPTGTSQICINHICSNFYVFSLKKQRALLNYIKASNPQMTTLIIKDVEDALKELSPESSFDNYGLYQKVDYIVDYGQNPNEKEHLNNLFKTSSNRYVFFKFWLLTPNRGFYNYADLEEIHSYVNTSTQLSIALRYLHDVRLQTLNIDFKFIKALRDLRYPTLFHIRNFIERPGDNIDLSSLLFCDILLTLKNSNGEKLQDFNGILDLAVTHSNPAYPNIDLGIRNFLPVCDGGLIPNPHFIGFIHYSVVYDFDESLITEENLKKTIGYILNKSADLQYHYCCANDNDKHLEEDIKKKCSLIITSYRKEVQIVTDENGNKIEKVNLVKEKSPCPHLQYKPFYPFTWKRRSGRDVLLNNCLNLNAMGEYFTQDDIDMKRLESNIRSMAAKTSRFILFNGNVPKDLMEREMDYHYFSNYYKATYIIIYPNKNIFYSSKKDLLGLWSNDKQTSWDNSEMDNFAQKLESPIIFEKTFQALKKMYPNGFVGKDYVAIPYDDTELRKVKDYFYFRQSYIQNNDNQYSYGNRDTRNNDNENKPSPLKFLYTPKLDENRIVYCTPKLADINEKVSDLPFFWCRSVECFCNVLDDQTLDKQNDWHQYSLYHAAEIIGYKLIDVTERGNIPDLKVAGFAAEVRQAERFYSRLVCRACGHMIFSVRGTILNGSRFFACQNPSCKQYHVEVYLSQCSNCKRGLIDSRDSKKCENGWVICPSCLACCNDKLFDTLIARHTRNGYVPPKIKANEGKGHNNKGLFFCPKCATKLGKITIEVEDYAEDGSLQKVNKEVFGCPECKKSYEKELKLFKDRAG